MSMIPTDIYITLSLAFCGSVLAYAVHESIQMHEHFNTMLTNHYGIIRRLRTQVEELSDEVYHLRQKCDQETETEPETYPETDQETYPETDQETYPETDQETYPETDQETTD